MWQKQVQYMFLIVGVAHTEFFASEVLDEVI